MSPHPRPIIKQKHDKHKTKDMHKGCERERDMRVLKREREKKLSEHMLVGTEQRQVPEAVYSQSFHIWQNSVTCPLLSACTRQLALDKILLNLDKCSHGGEQ
jgi:hypothetical protein